MGTLLLPLSFTCDTLRIMAVRLRLCLHPGYLCPATKLGKFPVAVGTKTSAEMHSS